MSCGFEITPPWYSKGARKKNRIPFDRHFPPKIPTLRSSCITEKHAAACHNRWLVLHCKRRRAPVKPLASVFNKVCNATRNIPEREAWSYNNSANRFLMSTFYCRTRRVLEFALQESKVSLRLAVIDRQHIRHSNDRFEFFFFTRDFYSRRK